VRFTVKRAVSYIVLWTLALQPSHLRFLFFSFLFFPFPFRALFPPFLFFSFSLSSSASASAPTQNVHDQTGFHSHQSRVVMKPGARETPLCEGGTGGHPLAAQYPQASLPGEFDIDIVAENWIRTFQCFLHKGKEEIYRLQDIFLAESYWRDHLCLSWDFHTWRGPDEITSFLQQHPEGCRLRRVSIERGPSDKKPQLAPIDHNGKVYGLQVFMELETLFGTGKGLARLSYDVVSQKWKAYTLYTALGELHGHAETVRSRRRPGFHYEISGTCIDFSNWQEMRMAQENFQEGLEPAVLIIGRTIILLSVCRRHQMAHNSLVGAGQAGLVSGARLAQLGVACLLIDQNRRLGDCWRKRYRRLVLHDPVWCKCFMHC
jgi:hypothetical protein